ncbi:alpha-ketoglutarate-dependent dioxygenase AlkB family protein [Pseudoroseicyclus sp. H15]
MTASVTPPPPIDLRGVAIWPGRLGAAAQRRLLAELRDVVAAAPLFRPETRRGPMSVQMTAAGRFGWVSDRRGYRYEERHPVTGEPWPEIPPLAQELWAEMLPEARAPESCLINLYREGAKMGLHQDKDEADVSQPVLSISLGDDALFRVGSIERGGKTASHWLKSGDVAVIGGDARLVHHGVDRVREGSSSLLEGGGRINLTMRVVT